MQLVGSLTVIFKLIRWKRWVFVVLAILALLVETYVVANPWLIQWQTASWLRDHVDDGSQIVSDLRGQEIQQLTSSWDHARSWRWQFVPFIETRPSLAWLGDGNHYLILDERTYLRGDFSTRVQALSNAGATLLYESHPLLPIGPRQAVFWPFKTDHPLNVSFDDNLLLIGYNLQPGANEQAGTNGQASTSRQPSLLLHWYVLRQANVAYHIFIHIFDPATGQLIRQADTELSNGTFSADHWRRNEIVFELVNLPPGLGKGKYRVQLGLYDLGSSKRAAIKRDDQAIGDTVETTLNF